MRRVITLSLMIVIVSLVVLAGPVSAFKGVQGQVIDSKTKQGWQYGGEVWVYDTSSSAICATGLLDANGGFSLSLDGTSNALGVSTVDCRTGYNGATFEILIDFNCSMGVGTCNPPAGTPGTIQHQFTQNPIPATYDAGYLETGTGPTAITLEVFSGSAATDTGRLPVGVLVGAMLLSAAGVVALVARRRR